MREYKFIISGLDCPNCSAKLERALEKSKILKEVNLTFLTKTLSLKSSENIEEVKKKLKELLIR